MRRVEGVWRLTEIGPPATCFRQSIRNPRSSPEMMAPPASVLAGAAVEVEAVILEGAIVDKVSRYC